MNEYSGYYGQFGNFIDDSIKFMLVGNHFKSVLLAKGSDLIVTWVFIDYYL